MIASAGFPTVESIQPGRAIKNCGSRVCVFSLLVCVGLLFGSERANATCSWHVVPSGNGGGSWNILNGVSAISATDAWAVGTFFDGKIGEERGLTEHWDGVSWTVFPSGVQRVHKNYRLNNVVEVSPADVWAVGYSEDSIMIQHWDGASWSVYPSPPLSGQLNAVTAISASNVWAVGSVYPGVDQTLIEHWNGVSWTVVPSPNASPYSNVLTRVAAVSAHDIWAVGYYWKNGTDVETLTEHWDGTNWAIVPSPNVGTLHNGLYGLAAISARDIWAVGFFIEGTQYKTLTEHWNGVKWSIVHSPSPNNTYNSFSGATATSPTDVWAVGMHRPNSSGETLTEHWDGTRWTVVSNPNPGYDSVLWDVVAVSSGYVLAVGNDFNSTSILLFQC